MTDKKKFHTTHKTVLEVASFAMNNRDEIAAKPNRASAATYIRNSVSSPVSDAVINSTLKQLNISFRRASRKLFQGQTVLTDRPRVLADALLACLGDLEQQIGLEQGTIGGGDGGARERLLAIRNGQKVDSPTMDSDSDEG